MIDSIVMEIPENRQLGPFAKYRKTLLAAFSALVYIINMGMVNAYSAPATVDMLKPGSRFSYVTPDQITWIASLPLFGSLAGGIVAGYVTNKLGRKAVLMLSTFSFVLSWLVIVYAPTIGVIYVGRIITGFFTGLYCVAVPAYLVEIAPTEIRGLLASGFQVSFTFGVFLSMALGIGLRWSWLAVFGASLATFGACLMLLMPESPSWLVRQCRSSEALLSLEFLRGKRADSIAELQQITENFYEMESSDMHWNDFRDPSLYKPTFIAIGLMFFQQFCGINALMSYTVEIFQNVGSSIQPNVAATLVASIQVIGTALAGILMDRSGRRRLYMTSGVFMTLALGALGYYSYAAQKGQIDVHLFGWIPLASFVVYIFSFSLGLGPIPYVMTPEMVPIRDRSTIIAIASVCCSIFAFFITKVYENMKFHLGTYGLYWTYGFFSLLSTIFCYFCMPETKGLSIHEIHKSFDHRQSSVGI